MIRTSFNNSSSDNIGMLQFKTQAPLGYSKKPDSEEYNQSGGALTDYATVENAKKFGKALVGAYSGETGTKVKNMIDPSDETARPSYQGEKHAIIKLPNGKMGIANYLGPGTNVLQRLRNGDPPRTATDAVAKIHDIDYQLASNNNDRALQLKLIREADNRMVDSLNRIDGKDSAFNIAIGKRVIQGKMLGEDMGVLDKELFAGKPKQFNYDEINLLLTEKGKLEQQGYGKKSSRAGQKLKEKILKLQVRKSGKLPKGMSVNKTFEDSLPYQSVNFGTFSGGGKPMGMLNNIISSLVPEILKNLGVSPNVINSNVLDVLTKMLMKKASADLPLAKMVELITKHIGPIVGMGYMKGSGVDPKGYSTLMKDKKRKNKYLGLLSKYVITKVTGKQRGGAWYDDLWSGIKNTFKPAVDWVREKVVVPVSDALKPVNKFLEPARKFYNPILSVGSMIPGPVGLVAKGLSVADDALTVADKLRAL